MFTCSRAATTVCVLALGLAGCSHMLENRAVDAFSSALADGDLDGLRDATSDTFSSKALRSTEALDDIEILKLPTGDTSIVEVEEGENEGEKKVTVQIGDSKKKRLLYKLVENEDGRWVVDDIYVRQRRRGHTATRSVTEQMDLLLSVREFLDAWTDGDRQDVLDVTAVEFGRVLSELPPAYLAQLTTTIAGSRDASESARKPEAQLDGERAIVTLPRTTGNVVLSMALDDEKWYVADVALESRRESDRIPSVFKRATALSAAVRFLESYAKEDDAKLRELATPTFYRRALKVADVSTVPLPVATGGSNYELTLQAHRADFVLPGQEDVVKVSLVRQDEEDVRGLPPVYRVEEVTLYEMDGSQEKRLSALFTAQASVLVFAEALADRDLPILRQTASTEFNRVVWDRLQTVGIEALPLLDVDVETPRIVSTVFNGAVTEVNVVQGPRAMTYVLQGRDADLRIHDVIVPGENRPTSLRETLELIVPVHLLAHGIQSEEIPLVQRSSSDDFNRLVWGQVQSIPPRATSVARHATAPPARIRRTDDAALVALGNPDAGIEVALVKERGFFVVDEMQIVEGPDPRSRWKLKDVLRGEIMHYVDGDQSVRRVSQLNGNRPAPTARRAPTEMTDRFDESISLDPLPAATSVRIDESALDLDPAPATRPVDGFDPSVELDESLGELTIE